MNLGDLPLAGRRRTPSRKIDSASRPRLLMVAVFGVRAGQLGEVHAVVPVLDRGQPDEFSLEGRWRAWACSARAARPEKVAAPVTPAG
jgi:anti-sigma factor RsiW